MIVADSIAPAFIIKMNKIKRLLRQHWKPYKANIKNRFKSEVEPLKNYVEAEEYHQDYLKKTRMAIAISTSKKADEPLIDDKNTQNQVMQN